MDARLAILFVTLAALGRPAMAADVRVVERHYTVRGATMQEIERQLERRGPKLGGHLGHPAATRMEFKTRVDYAEHEHLCRVASTHVSLVATMTLPRWNQPRNASRETVLFWQALDQDIRRHERRHADIAATHARRLESALTGLTSRQGCKALEARVARVTARIMKQNDDAHAAFDGKEGNEFERRLRGLIGKRRGMMN